MSFWETREIEIEVNSLLDVQGALAPRVRIHTETVLLIKHQNIGAVLISGYTYLLTYFINKVVTVEMPGLRNSL